MPSAFSKRSIKAIEKDLNINIDEVFHNFEKPCASSLAQVHKATLNQIKKEVSKFQDQE